MSRPFAPRLRVSSYLSAWMPSGDETRQPVAGYFAAGDGPSGALNRYDKLAFPTETKTTISATHGAVRERSCGYANSGVAGYTVGGGDSGGYLSSIEKLTFPNEINSTLAASLSTGRVYWNAGCANSGVAGYSMGGYDSGNISAIDKITFSADTKTTLSATLSSARQYAQGAAN